MWTSPTWQLASLDEQAEKERKRVNKTEVIVFCNSFSECDNAFSEDSWY
jgi:hypothetical protein